MANHMINLNTSSTKDPRRFTKTCTNTYRYDIRRFTKTKNKYRSKIELKVNF